MRGRAAEVDLQVDGDGSAVDVCGDLRVELGCAVRAAYQFLVAGRSGRAGYGEHVHGFEQVAFACAVFALQQGHARRQVEFQPLVVAEVGEADVRDVDGAPRGGFGLWL